MWTKGNNKGEWEVYSDGIISVDKSGNSQDVLTPKVSDVPECSSCANESFSVANPYIKFENHDARLIELAPRMAEALLEVYCYEDDNGEYHEQDCRVVKWGIDWDCRCIDKNLVDALRKMKHGEK